MFNFATLGKKQVSSWWKRYCIWSNRGPNNNRRSSCAQTLLTEKETDGEKISLYRVTRLLVFAETWLQSDCNLSSSEFQGNKNRLHSQRLTAHHSCPDALAEGIVHAGVTNGLQRKLYRHWNRKVLHWSKSVLYLRGMTKPHIWEIAHSVPPQVVHPQEISAWVTYMVVELPGHFWCHRSHFHPYPHTNNIHC